MFKQFALACLMTTASSLLLAPVVATAATSLEQNYNRLQTMKKAYDKKLSEVRQAQTVVSNHGVEVSSAEKVLKRLEAEREEAKKTLQKIQQLDRDNPELGLSPKVAEANSKNKRAHKNYQTGLKRLRDLNIQTVELKKNATKLETELASIKKSMDGVTQQIIEISLQAKISELQKPKTVEGYAEVACGNDTVRACKEKAKKAAELNASEKGSVVAIQSVTEIKNFKLSKDEVRSEVRARLNNIRVIKKGWLGETAYQYRISATVTPQITPGLRSELRAIIAADISSASAASASFASIPTTPTSSSRAADAAEQRAMEAEQRAADAERRAKEASARAAAAEQARREKEREQVAITPAPEPAPAPAPAEQPKKRKVFGGW